MRPLAQRWKTILESLPNSGELTRGTGLGMSLGATVLSEVMIANDTPLTNSVYVEAPNVAERKALELGKAFLTGGSGLAANIHINADPSQSEVAAEHLKSVNLAKARGIVGMGKFAAGIMMVSNRAVIVPMLRSTLGESIAASLNRGHGVVHAWGTQADVSPLEANRDIRDRFAQDTLYSYDEIEGETADHSITNIYALMGVLARHAAR